jgi:hypothetical protein
MSAVILAVFNDYETAYQVRAILVRDGFPTDRVELTAPCELGRVACQPAQSVHDKCVQYFRTLLRNEGEEHYPEMLAQRIDNGAATITVQPRGSIETVRATEILQEAHPSDVVAHDLTKQGWERAAAKHSGKPWIQHVWLEESPDTHCIYCRLFPGSSH